MNYDEILRKFFEDTDKIIKEYDEYYDQIDEDGEPIQLTWDEQLEVCQDTISDLISGIEELKERVK